MRTFFINKDGGIRWGVVTSLVSTVCLVIGLLVGAGIQIGGFATNAQVEMKIEVVKKDVSVAMKELYEHVDMKDNDVLVKVDAYKKANDEKNDRTINDIYKMLIELAKDKKVMKPSSFESDKVEMKQFSNTANKP